jgi:hypothetical protein
MRLQASSCDLLRQRKLQAEAQQARESIVAGYRDAIAGRTVEFKGICARC